MKIDEKDYDFLSVVLQEKEYNIFVKKKNRKIYKDNGFTTLGILFFLNNYGYRNKKNETKDMFPFREETKDSNYFYEYDKVVYQLLDEKDASIAMGYPEENGFLNLFK